MANNLSRVIYNVTTLHSIPTPNFSVKSIHQLHSKPQFKKSKLFVLFLILAVHPVFGAKEPMKFGKVDQSDLEMKVYPADSSASAVILCQYGYFNPARFQFVHQVRIKILKEEGKSQGNFYVPAAEKTNVKGQTVNLENGVPVVTKLGKEGIFIERVMKDLYRARVAMPNVKAGSVIDVEFYYDGFPYYWSFQSTIPIKWSEIIIDNNQFINFKKNYVGYIQLAVNESNRWVAKDVPAFVPEPYINNIDNYMARFNFEVESINVPGIYYKEYATSWKAVAQTFNNDDDFGRKIESLNLFLNSIKNEIKQNNQSAIDNMNSAYKAIKEHIKWNEQSSVWISREGLEYAFSKKLGNSAEINLSLLILLHKLGIEAYPVILSTRDNGTLPVFSASLSKFNYVIVQATIDQKNYLLDATEKYLPAGILPERALNEKGFLMNKEEFSWIDLIPEKKNKCFNLANFKLKEDGSLIGELNITGFDYSALNQRINYKSFNSEAEYLQDFEKKHPGLSVINHSCLNIDSLQNPVIEKFEVEYKNHSIILNDKLLFNPIIFNKLEENPFKIEDRLYPVDFKYPSEITDVINIEIPAGYTVDQLPKNIKMVLQNQTANFQMQTNVNENLIQILFKLNIKKPIYYTTEYKELKSLYNELVKKQSEMISLKKI